jgi:hypothetical protein
VPVTGLSWDFSDRGGLRYKLNVTATAAETAGWERTSTRLVSNEVLIEQQEIGAGDSILQTGSNRLEASRSPPLSLVSSRKTRPDVADF